MQQQQSPADANIERCISPELVAITLRIQECDETINMIRQEIKWLRCLEEQIVRQFMDC